MDRMMAVCYSVSVMYQGSRGAGVTRWRALCFALGSYPWQSDEDIRVLQGNIYREICFHLGAGE